MTRSTLWLVLVLMGPVLAQEANDAQRLRFGQLAYDDIAAIQVFDALGLTGDQARQIGAFARQVADRTTELEQQVAQAAAAALPELRLKRDALLQGKPISAAQLPKLASLEALRQNAADEQASALETAYTATIAVLTAAQQGRIRDDAPTADPVVAAVTRQQSAATRQQAIQEEVEKLFDNARKTPADRYRNLASREVAATVRRCTGMAPDQAGFQSVCDRFLSSLNRVYEMRSSEFRREGAAIAKELAEVAYEASRQSGVAVSPDLVRAALRYPRAATLLEQMGER